jgi:hypothetical protein
VPSREYRDRNRTAGLVRGSDLARSSLITTGAALKLLLVPHEEGSPEAEEI